MPMPAPQPATTTRAARTAPTPRPPILPVTVPTALRRPLRWPRTWPEVTTVTGGLALMAMGAAPLTGSPGLIVPLGGLGLLATATVGGLGARADRQAALVDDVIEALAPRSGHRCRVRAWGWRGGLVGAPSRITIRYAAGVVDDDPLWVTDVLDTVERRFQLPYAVQDHKARRRRLRLRAVRTPAPAEADLPELEQRATRIVTEVLGVGCTVVSTWSGDELVAVEVGHANVKVAASAVMRHRVERTFSTLMPGRWRARWDLEHDSVRLEQRPPLPTSVPRQPLPLDKDTLYRIPLAVDEDGRHAVWDLANSTGPHLLITGKTGLGKTVVIRGVVVDVARREWAVRVCDPKMIEYLGLRGWPNVEIVATTLVEQIVTIVSTYELMEHRYRLIEAGLVDERQLQPVVLVLDEVRELYAAISEWWTSVRSTGQPSRCPVLDKIAALARKSRSARIHLIIGTQRPDAEWLGGETRDNLATRFSAGPLSPQGAAMMWESQNVGVAVPRGIPGRGTAYLVDGEPGEVQALWTPDPRRARRDEDVEALALLDELMPANTRHPQLQVVLDEDLFNSVDAKGKPRQWAAIQQAELVPVEDDVEHEDRPELWGAPVYGTAPTSSRRGRPSSGGKVREPHTQGRDTSEPATPVATVLPFAPRGRRGEPASEAVVVASDQNGQTGAVGAGAGPSRDVVTPADDDELNEYAEGPEPGELEEDWEDEITWVPASALRAGDLICLDDAWMLVEDAIPDLDDEEYVCVDLRGDDDERSSASLPAGEEVALRPRRKADEGERLSQLAGPSGGGRP